MMPVDVDAEVETAKQATVTSRRALAQTFEAALQHVSVSRGNPASTFASEPLPSVSLARREVSRSIQVSSSARKHLSVFSLLFSFSFIC